MDLDSSSKSGPNSMVPIGIGLLGVVIGAIAIFMSISNGSTTAKQIKELSDTVDANSKGTATAQSVADLDGKVKMIGDTVSSLQQQMQTDLNKVADVINKQGEAITALSTRSAPKSTGGKGGTETSNVVAGQGGTAVIAAGDTFGKLATRYGVSVAAISAANPGVDSSKLKIGQKIVIPGGKSSPAPSSSSTPAAPSSAVTAP